MLGSIHDGSQRGPDERTYKISLLSPPQDLLPNKLTDYLYDLSVKYNDFYNVCQVIGSEQEASRLLLCEAVAVLMRTCFKLLGITALYRI